MLADKKLKAFVPTTNADNARAFYRDILRLRLLHPHGYALEFDCHGSLLRVAIVPELNPHPFTVLGWNVDNIAVIIKALRKKGVLCERYDFFEQDALGVWTSPSGAKVAWFKDHDGNILSLTEL